SFPSMTFLVSTWAPASSAGVDGTSGKDYPRTLFRSLTATKRNDPASDHLRPSVHQRRQALGQPGGLDAAGGRVCAVSARAWARHALHLRDRRARFDAGARRFGSGTGRGDVLRPAACRAEEGGGSLRSLLGLFRPLLEQAES